MEGVGFVFDDTEVGQGHDLFACAVFAHSFALLLLGQVVYDALLYSEVLLMSVDIVQKKLQSSVEGEVEVFFFDSILVQDCVVKFAEIRNIGFE